MIPQTSLDVLDKFAVVIFSIDQNSKYLMKVGGKDIKSITDTQIHITKSKNLTEEYVL